MVRGPATIAWFSEVAVAVTLAASKATEVSALALGFCFFGVAGFYLAA